MKKIIFLLGCLTLMSNIFSSSSWNLASIFSCCKSKKYKLESETKENLSRKKEKQILADEKRLFDILVELKVISLSAESSHIRQSHLKPRRFQGLTWEELYERQKKLIPEMESLGNKLANPDRFRKIYEEANKYAAIEVAQQIGWDPHF